jgi:tetratricopeptide (TPR) repeat protein
LNQAIKLSPDNPYNQHFFNARGLTNARLEKHQEALEDFNQAIKLSPDDPLSFYERGLTNTHLEKHQEALEDFNQAINLSPYDPLFFYKRGLTNAHLEKHQEALEDFNKAIELKIQKPARVLAPKLLSNFKSKQYFKLIIDAVEMIIKIPFDSTNNVLDRFVVSLSLSSILGLLTATKFGYLEFDPLQNLPRNIRLIQNLLRNTLRTQNMNPIVDLDDIPSDTEELDEQDKKSTREIIKSLVIAPNFAMFIDAYYVDEEERKAFQKISVEVAGEIFDRIGKGGEQDFKSFVKEKLNNIDDETKNKAQNFLGNIDELLRKFKEVTRNQDVHSQREELQNTIYKSAIINNNIRVNNFSKSIFKEVLEIFDEEVPKYLKEKHQELSEQKTAPSKTPNPKEAKRKQTQMTDTQSQTIS